MVGQMPEGTSAGGDLGAPSAPALRVLFVNENLGGHAALHRHLEAALAGRAEVDACFVHVPAAGLARRVLGAAVPGLARLDLDLQPLRAQLAASVVARRAVAGELAGAAALHVYSQNVALAWPGLLGDRPSVVATDGTNVQNATTLPYRDPTAFTPATVALTRRWERRVYRAATMVIAQSEWAARSIVGDYGVAADKVRVVRYGIPVRPPLPRERTEVPGIAFVGTTMRRKGGFALIDSYRRVLRGRAVLHLVTPEAVPSEPGIEVHSDVRPGDGRLERILARCEVFAFPSTIDKSSFAVMEAMAAGLAPVVASTGGLPELVEHGVSGVVVDPAAPGQLDAALSALVDDRSATAAMGQAARRRAQLLFDADITSAQTLEVVREAVRRFAAP